MSSRPQTKAEREASVALGKRLAQVRRERGLTQVELGEAIGVIQSVISSYEIGRVRPNPEILARLADALDVTADQLLGRHGSSSTTRGVDRRFLRRLRLVKTLPKRDQDALLRTIDAFLAARASR